MPNQFKTKVTIVALGGSLGLPTTTERIITGSKKLDGPNYLDDIVAQAYAEHYKCAVEDIDCRSNVSGIYSGSAFHHYNLFTHVAGLPKVPRFAESLVVYVSRDNMTPYEGE